MTPAAAKRMALQAARIATADPDQQPSAADAALHNCLAQIVLLLNDAAAFPRGDLTSSGREIACGYYAYIARNCGDLRAHLEDEAE